MAPDATELDRDLEPQRCAHTSEVFFLPCEMEEVVADTWQADVHFGCTPKYVYFISLSRHSSPFDKSPALHKATSNSDTRKQKNTSSSRCQRSNQRVRSLRETKFSRRSIKQAESGANVVMIMVSGKGMGGREDKKVE